MQFKCGKTDEEMEADRKARYDEGYRLTTTWTKRFAWLPTTIRPGKCVWLEYYERKLESVRSRLSTYNTPYTIADAITYGYARYYRWQKREIIK